MAPSTVAPQTILWYGDLTAKPDISSAHVLSQGVSGKVFNLVVEVYRIKISNVYKPPIATWENQPAYLT